MFSVIIILLLYILPTAIAAGREHNNRLAIFMLNVLLGWSLLGWIVALIWATTDNIKLDKKH